jgi:hypothetical protein
LLVDAYEGEMSLERAIDKLRWAGAGGLAHPTASCAQYRRQPDGTARCTCGLWRAIAVATASPVGRMLVKYANFGELPR